MQPQQRTATHLIPAQRISPPEQVIYSINDWSRICDLVDETVADMGVEGVEGTVLAALYQATNEAPAHNITMLITAETVRIYVEEACALALEDEFGGSFYRE